MEDVDKKGELTDILRRMSKTIGVMAGASRRKLDESTNVAKESTFRIAESAANTAGTLFEATASTADFLRSMPGRALERLIQEAPVPVFLLPTGPHADDFLLVFDFHRMIKELKSGVLVRPVIQLYTGREDFDRAYFADHLKDEFVRQFNLAKEKERIDYEADVENFESKRRTAKEEMTGPFGWVGGIIFQYIFSDPTGMTALVFLALFVHKGKRAFRPLMDYIDLSTQMRKREKELSSRIQELDKKFNRNNKTFQRAVNHIDVVVHPQIVTLVELICEVEGVSVIPTSDDAMASDYPDITELLIVPDYVEALPSDYRPLLTVI